MVRNQRRQAKGEMERYRTQHEKTLPSERTPCIPMFLSSGMGQLQCKCGGETNSNSSSLDLLMRTILVQPSAQDASK